MAYTNIDDPSSNFQTALYTGNSNYNTITNTGNSNLAPDFIYIKCRSSSKNGAIYDSSRGTETPLLTNSTTSEGGGGDNGVLNFGDGSTYVDGFRLGSANNVNDNGENFIAYQFKVNGGTITTNNTDGTTATNTQVNSNAGISIVTWTGNGSNATMGHGLGLTPKFIITKARGSTGTNWATYHRDIDASAPYNYIAYLNTTDGGSIASNSWGTSLSNVNSSTFYMKYWINHSTSMVAWVFAEKQGFSKFGKYKANGSANGPFNHTGFKPAWILFKDQTGGSGGTENWQIWSSTINTYNPLLKVQQTNTSSAESVDLWATYGIELDVYSNGFKIVHDSGKSFLNMTNRNYIWAAFAENPFVTSTGIPATAR